MYIKLKQEFALEISMQQEQQMLSSDYFVNQEEGSGSQYISQFFYGDKAPFQGHLLQEQFKDKENNDKATEAIQIVSLPVSFRPLVYATTQPKRRRKDPKASPFHNYQKHLITFLRQVILLPSEESGIDLAKSAAHQLWTIFATSTNTTKKILHYIFNQENEHKLTTEQLNQFGFLQLYQKISPEQMSKAKKYLSYIALKQTTSETIDGYLKKRRIRNTFKFKKYIELFRKQLEQGFLKKRFTNPSKEVRQRKFNRR